MKNEKRERKIRSDKRRDVKPTIPVSLYECIARISYVTSTPMKDVAEMICKKGLYSTIVIEHLSVYFRRDYWANSNILYTGDLDKNPYKISKGIEKRRLSIRFLQKDHDKLARLSYSLDTTVSSATALLLEYAIKNTDIVNTYLSYHVKRELDTNRLKQLREVLKFINSNNPYEEELTLGAFISMLMEEFKGKAFTVTESLKRWIDDTKY